MGQPQICNSTSDTQASNVPVAQEKPLILIIDDEPSICRTLSQVLEDEEFRTITAQDGVLGLAVLEENQPSLVFLDIWMPGLDGLETLERIKGISPRTEVVMISGHATIANAIEATRRGAFDFIEKPLDLDTVVRTAHRALTKMNNMPLPDADVQELGEGLRADIGGVAVANSQYRHPGVMTDGLKGRNIGQRTIRQSAILYGQGLHSGKKSGLILEPLPKDSGIHFSLTGRHGSVPAFVDYVDSASFATTIRQGEVSISTIEHLMAALHSYRVSNLLVKCNGEVPIIDGSALDFCRLIDDVGLVEQGGEWYEVVVDEKVSWAVEGSKEHISLEPSEFFSVTYILDYPTPVGRQEYTFTLKDKSDFVEQIAPARTFGFMRDIERLQKVGLAAGGRLDNFILIGQDGVVNTTLRFPDELARHKVLDVVGDLFLLGRPLRAKVTAAMTGHSDNVRVLSFLRDRLQENRSCKS